MLAHKTGHLEHRDLVLAHHRLQRCVAKDVAFVRGILQVVRLDVVPEALGDLRSWQRFGTDNNGECGAWLECLHESGGLGWSHVWHASQGKGRRSIRFARGRLAEMV